MAEGEEPQFGDDVVTVAELNERIAAVVDGSDRLHDVSCLGEVSQCNEYDWGAFLDLVYDGHELTAVLWGHRYDELDVDIEAGDELVLTGDVDFYAEKGRINLKPWAVTLVGEGDRAIRLQRLRAELESRGWFDEAHKRELPGLPARVGVVTSLDGDARYDLQESIHDRYPDVDLLFRDARVQGEHAPTSIAAGLQALDRDHDVDVIVVGRGGGSETDLAAFDSEPVAEAVFTARTPVVAAVGHREDHPIVADVADETAITPTDAGSVVVPEREVLETELADLESALSDAYERTVTDRLRDRRRRLAHAYEAHVERSLADLDRGVRHAFEGHVERSLADLDRRVRHAFEGHVERSLADLDRRVEYAFETHVERSLTDLDRRVEHAFESRTQRLEQADRRRELETALAERDRRLRRQRYAIVALVALLGLTVLFVLIS